jgi:glutamine amidotransferase
MLLTVVDYGVGNLRSIAKSIEKASSANNLSYSVKVSSDINDVKKSDKIVLPGQGSFKACKEGIDKIAGLKEELNESVLIKKKTNFWNLRWDAIVCHHWLRRRKNKRIKLDSRRSN